MCGGMLICSLKAGNDGYMHHQTGIIDFKMMRLISSEEGCELMMHLPLA